MLNNCLPAFQASKLMLANLFRMNPMKIAAAGFFAIAFSALLSTTSAQAQLFGRSDDRRPQDDAADLSVRIERMENQMRQMTGTIEELQYKNQQIEQQLRAIQGGASATGPRPQVMTPGPGLTQGSINEPPSVQPQMNLPPVSQQPTNQPGRRGDAFDPSAQPNAPGAPRVLGRPGQPLDMGALANGTPNDPNLGPPPGASNRVPGQQQAVLPPSGSAKDEYDLAYGYILRRDYALADEAFRVFLQNHEGDRLVPDAHYWLGESQFQRQLYNDAAETFLDVYNKYPNSLKAPEALLRLGQSLAAIGKQDAACASFGAVLTKYPKASAQVKATVAAEQKRVRC